MTVTTAETRNEMMLSPEKPQTCPLAQIPTDLLHKIFVHAGPDNNLHLTCQFFREVFRFEDTGYDERGVWPNLNLAISMIRAHYMRYMNSEFDKFNFPFDYLKTVPGHISEIENLWMRRRCPDVRPLKSAQEYRVVQNFVRYLPKLFKKFKQFDYAVNQEIMHRRFITPRLIGACFTRRHLIPNATRPDERIAFYSPVVHKNEELLRSLFLVMLFAQIHFILDELHSSILGIPPKATDDDPHFPPELEVLDKISNESEPSEDGLLYDFCEVRQIEIYPVARLRSRPLCHGYFQFRVNLYHQYLCVLALQPLAAHGSEKYFISLLLHFGLTEWPKQTVGKGDLLFFATLFLARDEVRSNLEEFITAIMAAYDIYPSIEGFQKSECFLVLEMALKKFYELHLDDFRLQDFAKNGSLRPLGSVLNAVKTQVQGNPSN